MEGEEKEKRLGAVERRITTAAPLTVRERLPFSWGPKTTCAGQAKFGSSLLSPRGTNQKLSTGAAFYVRERGADSRQRRVPACGKARRFGAQDRKSVV